MLVKQELPGQGVTGFTLKNDGFLQQLSSAVNAKVKSKLSQFEGTQRERESIKLDAIMGELHRQISSVFDFYFSAISIIQVDDKSISAVPIARHVTNTKKQSLFRVGTEELVGNSYEKARELLLQNNSQLIVYLSPDLIQAGTELSNLSVEALENALIEDMPIEGLPIAMIKALQEGTRGNIRIHFLNEGIHYVLILSTNGVFPDDLFTEERLEVLTNIISYLQPILIAQYDLNKAARALEDEQEMLGEMLTSVVINLSELKDNDTQLHTKRVGLMAQVMIDHLIETNFEGIEFSKEQKLISEVSEEDLFYFGRDLDHEFEKDSLRIMADQKAASAVMLHDIGKVGIADSILLHPGKLVDHAWEQMKAHVTIGASIIRGTISKHPKIVESPTLRFYLLSILAVVEQHHEKWDGSGYPLGLKGSKISVIARVTAIVDVYDALRSVRPYKPEKSIEVATAIIKDESGKHFDPQLVKIFLSLIDKMELIQSDHSDDASGFVAPPGMVFSEILYRLSNIQELIPKLDKSFNSWSLSEAQLNLEELTGRRYSMETIELLQLLFNPLKNEIEVA